MFMAIMSLATQVPMVGSALALGPLAWLWLRPTPVTTLTLAAQPVDRQHLPNWVAGRLARQQQRLNDDAVDTEAAGSQCIRHVVEQHQQIHRAPRRVDDPAALGFGDPVELRLEDPAQYVVAEHTVGGLQLDPALQPGADRVGHHVVEQCDGIRGDVVGLEDRVVGGVLNPLLDHCLEQVLLALEVAVQPFLAGIGFGRNTIQPGTGKSKGGELHFRGSHDALTCCMSGRPHSA